MKHIEQPVSFLKSLIVLLLCWITVGCSTIDKATYYKFEPSPDNTEPKLSYEATTQRDHHTSAHGFPLKIIYEKKFRFFQINQYQYAQISFKHYGYKLYSMGPMFLPVIPNIGSWLQNEQEIPKDAQIEIDLIFDSDPVFEAVTADLPNLEIINHKGQSLKPKIEVSPYGAKTFVFDAKIGETPWFILKEAMIKLSNGKTLKIPETKFVLEDDVNVYWMLPIAP